MLLELLLGAVLLGGCEQLGIPDFTKSSASAEADGKATGAACRHAGRAIVELMVRIAHTFNLEVVAEGVENREAEDALSRMGCDVAQGYLYAPPMPVHEFVDWWARAEAVLAAEHP